MIAGRPTNLWLGLTTAVTGAVQITLVSLGFDPVLTATVLGAWGVVLGAVILLIAGQPPTLNPGDKFHVTTPEGQPNQTTTVATPPAADAPPVPQPGG